MRTSEDTSEVMDDLEEGEITEIIFDSRFDTNSDKSDSKVSKQTNINTISPIFQTMFDQKSDSLFGFSDTDLRFTQNPNAFNDCDERLVSDNSFVRPMNVNQNFGQKQSFVTKTTNISNHLRPRMDAKYMPLSDNRFHSLDMRPEMPLNSMPFRLSENQMSPQMRPQLRPMNALLPTPVMPFRHPEPNQPFSPICHPFRPRFDVPFDPRMHRKPFNSSQTSQSVPSIPPKECIHEPNPVPHSYVVSHSSESIPFISDTNIRRNENEFYVKSNETNDKTIDESFDSKVDKFLNELNNKTIIIDNNRDIEVVEMQMSDHSVDDDLSPYDPEQDIIPISEPLSPPAVAPNDGMGNTKRLAKNIDENYNQKSNEKMDSNLNEFKNTSNTRTETDGRKERLNRLLKSDNSFENNNKLNKSRNRSKNPMKRSIRMTPRFNPKFRPLSSPIRETPVKLSVHRKTCKRDHKSRRKVKRMARREVYQIPQQRNTDLRPKFNNTLIRDSSYEDLIEEYKRIQKQLKELETEEKNDLLVERGIDSEEQEKIDRLMKSQDIPVITDDSKVDQIVIETKEDDDEQELRRLALESKRKRETQEEEEIQEEEELLLRQQLLKSLFKPKPKSYPQICEENKGLIQSNEVIVDLVDNSLKPKEVEEIITETEIPVNDIPETEVNAKAVTTKPIQKLIINFGDDSTDEEMESQEVSKDLGISSFPIGLDSFIRQVRMRSEANTHTIHPRPVMSTTKQRELQELKAEIARRERNQINDTKLKRNEILWKTSKERLKEKISKQSLLKNRVTLKRNALRKAQVNARKMQEAFIAATRVVSATASEFHKFNEEFKTIEKDVKQEVINISRYEKECIRMGLKLHGNSYKLPIGATVERTDGLNTSVSPIRKRLKSDNNVLTKEAIESEKKRLIQELKDCTKLLEQKSKTNATFLRPSSPKVSAIQSTCASISETANDSEHSLQTLVNDLIDSPFSCSLISLNCFIENMFSFKSDKCFDITIAETEGQISDQHNTYCDESYDSVLSHLHSYRLIDNQPKDISADHWTNDLNPLQEICRFDLLGTCNDSKCLGQHLNQFILNGSQKLVDLLLYEPRLAGITSQIPERIDVQTFDAIKQKLLQFSQKQIDFNPKVSLETHCRRIAKQIRNGLKEPVICLLTRRIPKIFNTCKIDVPFDDLKYKFSIKDKTLVINQSKISELKLSADPDIYFKNRFYAPEGVPISAQLETTLANDPHNIQLWIKLAYYHISRCSDYDFADSIDRALNVLSRALDHNIFEPELYEHYLFIYSNRVVRKDEDLKMGLTNICHKVVEHCSHYRVWKCVLTLFTNFNQKIKVSEEVIDILLNNTMQGITDFESRSHKILEIFLYKISLKLQQNIPKQSLLEFSRGLDRQLSEETDNGSHFISDQLTESDRVFAWLCFTYVLIHNHLPNHCFELSKQGFPQLINKNAFIFDWISVKSYINFNEMKEHLINASKHCELNDKNGLISNQNCFAIHINLAEICLVIDSDPKCYENLLQLTKNNSILWPFIAKHGFKANELNLISFDFEKQNTFYSKENNLRIRLKVAKHLVNCNDIFEARNQLFLIVSDYYTNYEISETTVGQAFETLLLENEENNYNFELINARNGKQSHCPLLWLSYILLLQIDCHSCQRIDSAFQTSIGLCSVHKTDPKDLQLLWSNYLEFLVRNIRNEKQFNDLFESVRHCCLTITDPIFQSQVIQYLCHLLSNDQKLDVLIQFSKLIPENPDLILSAISCGLKANKRERIWALIQSIVFDKKIRFKCFQFWKIAIGLAIDRCDHLSVHKFFQIAISLLPFNSILWQNFKKYETLIKHSQHLRQAKDICDNELEINF